MKSGYSIYSCVSHVQKIFTGTLLTALLLLGINPAFAAPPPNDNFANAEVIGGTNGSIAGSTVEASAEIGEPDHSDGGAGAFRSIWYTWQAPSNASIKFSGGGFDTFISVYTGNAVNSLTQVVAGTQDSFTLEANAIFTPTAGETYHIAVDQPFSPTGEALTLGWQPWNIISGTITLPSPVPVGSGGWNIAIDGNDQNFLGVYRYTNVFIAEGDSSGSYTLDVPPDPSANWRINYQCSDCPTPLLKLAYYASGAPDTTTWDSNQASLLPGDADYIGINMTVLTGDTVSGVITLPNPVPAGSGDLNIDINAFDLNGPGSASTTVFVAEGDTSSSYSMAVPPDASASWQISYICWGCEAPILREGYYASGASNTTIWDVSQATLLPGGSNHLDINMTAILGNTISGTITLPNPVPVGSGGRSMSVRTYNQSGPGYASSSVFIDEGDSSGSYNLGVPPDASANWQVSFNCWSCEAPILREGYYASGETNTTSWDRNLSTLLPGNVDHVDKNMTVITGNIIVGTVNLPNPVPAGSGSLNVEINASNQNGLGYGHTSVFISEGDSLGSYSMAVPPDAGASWLVSYNCWSCEAPMVKQGYYASGETNTTSWDSDLATILPGNTDHTGINMTVMTGNTIVGTINLPSPVPIGSGGLEFGINADDQNSSSNEYTGVFIDEGASSGSYALAVPAENGASWQLSYNCSYGCEGIYLQEGYYADSAHNTTTWDSNLATPLPGNSNHTNINMTAIVGNTISGTITLPNPVPAGSEGWSIDISAYNRSGSGYGRTSVLINEGESSGSYTLTALVPDPSASWEVLYNCWDCEAPLLGEGYYASGSPNTTTWDGAQATLLSGNSDYTDIDMTVMSGNTISGTITLPSPAPADSGGKEFLVRAVNSTTYYARTFVFIGEGDSAGSYDIAVPPDASAQWLVSYECIEDFGTTCEGYVSEGYYDDDASNTTSWNSAEAAPLPGNSDYTDIDMTVMTGNTISGTINLPNPVAVGSWGVSIEIKASLDGIRFANTHAFIDEGGTSSSYTLIVPSDAGISWEIGYYCGQFDCAAPSLREGYYASSATNTTTWNYNQATLLSGNVDYNDINLTVMTGNTISGAANLPSAASEDKEFHLNVRNQSGSVNIAPLFLYYESGESSLDYELAIPAVAGEYWLVSYECLEDYTNCDGYILVGYYASPSVTVSNALSASYLGNQDYTDINLHVIPGHELAVSITGDGSVASTPSGINCSPDCEFTYEATTTVELIANADVGSAFSEWGGACTGELTNTCNVNMDAAKSVTVVFAPDFDGDGVIDDEDNCPNDANPDQSDSPDNDGIGDVCDVDDDDDGILDGDDNCPVNPNPDQTDSNDNDIGDACENDELCFPVKSSNGAMAIICL